MTLDNLECHDSGDNCFGLNQVLNGALTNSRCSTAAAAAITLVNVRPIPDPGRQRIDVDGLVSTNYMPDEKRPTTTSAALFSGGFEERHFAMGDLRFANIEMRNLGTHGRIPFTLGQIRNQARSLTMKDVIVDQGVLTFEDLSRTATQNFALFFVRGLDTDADDTPDQPSALTLDNIRIKGRHIKAASAAGHAVVLLGVLVSGDAVDISVSNLQGDLELDGI